MASTALAQLFISPPFRFDLKAFFMAMRITDYAVMQQRGIDDRNFVFTSGFKVNARYASEPTRA
jgi:hypothetical protein